MNGVNAKTVASYVLLPQIIPRAKALFASGFGYIAFLMASIYGSVRLLPREHPYLNPQNIGKYGVLHVITEAANGLVLKKENADQIAMFIAILAGVVILVAQFVLIIYAMVFHPAQAASLFITPAPTGPPPPGVPAGTATDMAFMVLDQVFGIPDMFCTDGGNCTQYNASLPWPFHVGFHELLRFYSLGLLIVGVVIFLYYVVVVIGETATTGNPFGQRFQNAWAPIRLVVALGLLVPINYGLNSSQYIVLYAAKFGSSFATNGWLQFNETISAGPVFGGGGSNPIGERDSLLAQPNRPSVMPMVQMMTIVHACAYAWWKLDSTTTNAAVPPDNFFYIQPYFVKLPQPNGNPNTYQQVTAGTTYVNALDFYDNSDIIIRFGRRDSTTTTSSEKGQVVPMCGDVRIPIHYLKTRGQGGSLGGPDAIQEFYFNLVRDMWFNDGLMRDLPQRYMEVAINRAPDLKCQVGCDQDELPECAAAPTPPIPHCSYSQVGSSARQELIATYDGQLDAAIALAWSNYNANSVDFQMRPEILDRGWAGAGIWYNTIAEINGAFVSSIVSMPMFQNYPYVMKTAREERRKNDSDPSPIMQFNPNLKDGKPVTIDGPPNSVEVAQKLNDFFIWWNKDDPDQTKSDNTVKGGPFQDAIKAIFGLNGLFEMRGKNAHIHPLAQLASVGKSLVDSAILNIGTSTVTAGLGGILRVVDQHGLGPAADVVSGITMTIAFLGLTVGFILYYVLPFLPFLYFFFAFGTWIKSIFEAMVGAPLWALAHLRLDGEGLPGDSASSGYFLIFEIFIRPILTVFGLIASILILTAQVRLLNVLWTLITSNLTGFEGFTLTAPGKMTEITAPGYEFKILPKNDIDTFFFTIVYAIIVYMMATASFKMIDKIPDQLLRFMGAGVSAFSDINPDPTEGLTRYAALGGITVGQQATQALRGLSSSVGGALGKELGEAAAAIKGTPKPPG